MRARRVVLLGFMASGKTAVGRALARRMGWAHVDLDQEIEREVGQSIAEIFRTRGEAGFRELEVHLTPQVMGRTDVVVSPGGGWVTNPGIFDRLPPDTLTVWLRVAPAEIARRLARSRARQVRPLLETADPQRRIEELLAQRAPLYAQASVVIDTEGRSVQQVARVLEGIVRGGNSTPTLGPSNAGHGSETR